jgi:hypothetical protein
MRRRNAGFTVVELLIVLLVGTIVLGSILQVLAGQSRAARHQGAVVTTQQTTRLGLEVLAAELREISARGGDLLVATPDSVRFRALRKLGIACDFAPIVAPGVDVMSIDVFELGPEPFLREDSLLVFVDGDSLTARDDIWVATMAENASSVIACGALLGSLFPADTEVRRLDVPAGIPREDVGVGAPVRSFVRLTYGLYNVAGEWVLGMREGAGAVQPLVGPLAPPAEGGLVFRYFDAGGTELTPVDAATRAQVARISVSLRGKTPGAVSGGQNIEYVDSLVTHIHIRGNPR